MPTQALVLALAASIYPPAVAAVIALGRGAEVRSRVAAFVFASLLVTYAVGALILYALVELGATGSHHLTPGAAVDVALGAVQSSQSNQSVKSTSKIERYLQSRRLAFVLGIVLYVLPSPIYIGAVKSIADASLSTGDELLWLLASVVVMLWMVELPMLMLLVVPDGAADALEHINLWFSGHGRSLAITAAVVVGVYLIVTGLAQLI
jgi:Sap, sulfolipid-1-addressing protein